MKKHAISCIFLFVANTLWAQIGQNFVDKPVWQFTILFDVNKATIQTLFESKLDSLAVDMAKDTSFQVEIKAHTDNSGSNNYNEKLSKSRAETVKSYLTTKEIDEKCLKRAWKGECDPISGNDTEGGKMQNDG